MKKRPPLLTRSTIPSLSASSRDASSSPRGCARRHTTLSRAGEDWQGARGYVQEHVRRLALERSNLDAYICGLKDMVEANRALLKGFGWDRKSIHFERFD